MPHAPNRLTIEPPCPARSLRTVQLDADLVVVGGGMTGVCAAITAARAGTCVLLVQDRPVLGGNASSEVRLWILGATSHMNANNRWAREGGVIDEILTENLYRNPEGNPVLVDPLLLEKVTAEPNITLLLNTAVFEVGKAGDDPDSIQSVGAFCGQNSTRYVLRAPLFCDASGDGVMGFLAGAAFRMGAEAPEEFGEPFAPRGEFGGLLGHSLYFFSKDTGRPVRFTPPAFALRDVPGQIPRHRLFNTKEHGAHLWWIEWGGMLDTVHDTERIKWEFWKVAYGVWDYLKNSGRFPEAANLTLEWVGMIPGKRESRRFEGAYMLRQRDIVQRRHQDDAVAFGGWSIDLHPGAGIYSPIAGSHHLHGKGIYPIPYRCYYSRNIRNLFFAGRIISASHVAFGSTRVMATCAHGGQAVGMAAALCRRLNCRPADLSRPERIKLLQCELLRTGQHLPGFRLEDPEDLARQATISATSQWYLGELPPDGPMLPLASSTAQVLPLHPGPAPRFTLWVDAAVGTALQTQLRVPSDAGHHSPDVTLAVRNVALQAGRNQCVTLDFGVTIARACYAFVCLLKNEHLAVRCSERRVTGLLRVYHSRDELMSPMGGEDYEVWRALRRPDGHNLALRVEPPVAAFAPEAVVNGLQRPTDQPNAWVADLGDKTPALTLSWDQPRTIRRLELFFDTDYDFSMESVVFQHPERAVPFCVRHYRVRDSRGRILSEQTDNHQARNTLRFDPPAHTDRLSIEVLAVQGDHSPAAILEVRCYS